MIRRYDASEVSPLSHKRFWRTDNKQKRCVCIIEFTQPEIPVEVGDLVQLCMPGHKEALEILVFNTDDQVRAIVKELDYEQKDRGKEEAAVPQGKVCG